MLFCVVPCCVLFPVRDLKSSNLLSPCLFFSPLLRLLLYLWFWTVWFCCPGEWLSSCCLSLGFIEILESLGLYFWSVPGNFCPLLYYFRYCLFSLLSSLFFCLPHLGSSVTCSSCLKLFHSLFMLTHFIFLKIREREVERDLPSIVLQPPKDCSD